MGVLQSSLLSFIAAVAAAVALSNKVLLLLKTNGVNNSNNNTFIDSSSSNLTITSYEDVTQGSFSPYSCNGWSTEFNGTTDNFSISANAAFSYGTGAFTWECCVYLTETLTNSYILDHGVNGGIFAIQSGYLTYYDGVVICKPAIVPLNKWVHLAISRQVNVVRLFIDGVQVGSVSSTHSFPTLALSIGKHGGGGLYFKGHLSNLRIVNGTPLYTSDFIPSTIPLTPISNTVLLTCQDNRVIDKSINNFDLVVAGTPKVVNISPYNPDVYDPVIHGGSIYFDGTADYLTAPGSANFVFSGDHALECWLYPKVLGVDIHVFGGGGGGSSDQLLVHTGVGNGYIYWGYSAASGYATVANSLKIPINQWTHIAISRISGVIRAFINGVFVGSLATDISIGNSGALLFVGRRSDGTGALNGYISDLRVVNNVGIYVSNFNVPTAPLTAIANTKLLLNGTNSGVYDSTGHFSFDAMGTAKVSTSKSKSGLSSMYFDGTSGCYIKANPSELWNLGTKDFCITFWYYKSAQATINARLFSLQDGDVVPGLTIADNAGALTLYMSSNGTSWNIANNVALINLEVNTWNYVRLFRVGTNINLNSSTSGALTDGAGSNVTSSAAVFHNSTFTPVIGGQSTPLRAITGYIDEFQITVG